MQKLEKLINRNTEKLEEKSTAENRLGVRIEN